MLSQMSEAEIAEFTDASLVSAETFKKRVAELQAAPATARVTAAAAAAQPPTTDEGSGDLGQLPAGSPASTASRQQKKERSGKRKYIDIMLCM